MDQSGLQVLESVFGLFYRANSGGGAGFPVLRGPVQESPMSIQRRQTMSKLNNKND